MALNDIDFIRYLISLTENTSPTNEDLQPIIVNIGSNNDNTVEKPNGRENNIAADASFPEDDEEEIIVSRERRPEDEYSEPAGEDNQEEVESPMDRDDLFIPPLQAKLEIMKKLAGIQPKNQNLIASEDDEPFED